MNIVEVAYNVQAAIDDKHNLAAEFEVTNETDFGALAPMCAKTRMTLEVPTEQSITVLADKGYYSAKQIAKCHDNNIDTLVSPKKKGSKSKDTRVTKNKFIYDHKTDSYTCPQKMKLRRHGKIYHRKDGIPFKRYGAHWTDCKKCPWVDICVSPGSMKVSKGRMLNRTIYDENLDRNDKQVAERKDEYRRRQAIVEHPFGTIKRQWGYDHTLLKGLQKVKGEFALIMICYNLRRVISILGFEELKKALKSHFSILFNLKAIITPYYNFYRVKA